MSFFLFSTVWCARCTLLAAFLPKEAPLILIGFSASRSKICGAWGLEYKLQVSCSFSVQCFQLWFAEFAEEFEDTVPQTP